MKEKLLATLFMSACLGFPATIYGATDDSENKLSAPSFNLKEGASVNPGTKIKVFVPANATEIVYSINGGEEKSITARQMAFIKIDADSEVVAYAKGGGMFLDSDKVTINLSVDGLAENVDYACASNFLEANGETMTTGASFCNLSYGVSSGDAITTKGQIPSFTPYRDADRNTQPFVVYNTSPYEGGITKIKVYYGSSFAMGDVYVKFSETAPVTEITEDMLGDDYTSDYCYKVGNNGIAGYDEWIDLSTLKGFENDGVQKVVPKYVTIWSPSSSYATIQGIFVEYADEKTKLSAPSFNLKEGASVNPGTKIKVFVPANATEIVYSINGGEEVSITAQQMAFIKIDADSEVVAYARGGSSFLDSDKVTINLSVDALAENVDYACASNFLEADGETVTAGTSFCGFGYGLVSGDAITKKGQLPGFTPYRDADRVTHPFVVYNTTPYEGGISKIKVYYGSTYAMGDVYVKFSETAPVTDITEDMLGDDYTSDYCYKVGTNGIAGYDAWIDLSTLKGFETSDNAQKIVPKYVTVWSPSSSYATIQGIFVEYSDVNTGIKTIELDDLEDGVIFNLSGLRMTGHDLAPGIYLRKENGKFHKILVK